MIKLSASIYWRSIQRSNSKSLLDAVLFTGFWTIIIFIFIHFSLFHNLVLFWFVPLLVINPILQKVRSIAEHFAISYEDEYTQARNVEGNFVEKFLFCPHSVNYHLTHHFFPLVPHYNLRAAHNIVLADPEFDSRQHSNRNYFYPFENSVLSDLILTANPPVGKANG